MAQISASMARPTAMKSEREPTPVWLVAVSPVHNQRQLTLPAASAPLASHRSCQVKPGCCSSHRTTLDRPLRRLDCPVGLATVNGGNDNRANTSSADAQVEAHDRRIGRGGNRESRTDISRLGISRAARITADPATCMAVTRRPGRTAHPTSPDGIPAFRRRPATPQAPQRDARDEPAHPRSPHPARG